MAGAKIKKNIEKAVKDLADELFKKLKIEAQIEVLKEKEEQEEEKGEHYILNINTEESGLLIGRHGETLNSIQLLFGLMLFHKLGEWHHVILDVGGYRKAREESIREMVEKIAAQVQESGEPVVLPYLSPLERRIVHLMLTESESVVSESSGEGRERRVTIKPK